MTTPNRRLHPTDISVRDDPETRAFILVCDEHEVGRLTYREVFDNIKAGRKPADLIRAKLESLEWATGA